MKHNIYLGVNVDHVATLRQARFTVYPDPVEVALIAEKAGADGITVHLREDRRHIQEKDVSDMMRVLTTRLNLEMAMTEAMLQLAERYQPKHCCFVPEKREELTTEGGLNIVSQQEQIKEAVSRLSRAGIEVSLFIDPDPAQVEAAARVGASTIELNTGAYADAVAENQKKELKEIIESVTLGHELGLIVNAGHGLTLENVQAIAALDFIHELNIGHAIVARAIFVGIAEAVREMKQTIYQCRANST